MPGWPTCRSSRVLTDGWFTGLAQRDYRTMARAEHRRSFTFTPDLPVTTPAEFTDALFAYAREQHLDLVVTQGRHEFPILPSTASRIPG